jgi:signal transduction histidine kinase
VKIRAAGTLASLMVVLFAILSAMWFYQEQLESSGGGRSPSRTEKQIADARSDVTELVAIYLLVLPLVVLIVAAGAWWVAGRLTRPLVRLADAAAAIDARTLHERLPEPNTHDEIAQLASVLNSVFGRLEASFAQAGRFAADASHELRTPLAVMRGRIELAINEDPVAPHAIALVQLLEDNQRLIAITEKLLLLARADAGKLATEASLVSLSGLLEGVLEDFAFVDSAQSLQLNSEIAPGVIVHGEEALLRQLFLNLFENAVKFTPPRGTVRVLLERLPRQAVFTIANSGSGIPPEIQSRLFERFFRSSHSRDRETGGAGLGLSLCREIAAAHRGQLEFVSSDEFETIFRVILPLNGRACG